MPAWIENTVKTKFILFRMKCNLI